VGSGTLDALIAKGFKYMFVSNSDNLGATMDLKLRRPRRARTPSESPASPTSPAADAADSSHACASPWTVTWFAGSEAPFAMECAQRTEADKKVR